MTTAQIQAKRREDDYEGNQLMMIMTITISDTAVTIQKDVLAPISCVQLQTTRRMINTEHKGISAHNVQMNIAKFGQLIIEPTMQTEASSIGKTFTK